MLPGYAERSEYVTSDIVLTVSICHVVGVTIFVYAKDCGVVYTLYNRGGVSLRSMISRRCSSQKIVSQLQLSYLSSDGVFAYDRS